MTEIHLRFAIPIVILVARSRYFSKAFGLTKLNVKATAGAEDHPSYYDLSSLRAPLMDLSLSQRIRGGGGGATVAEVTPIQPPALPTSDTLTLQCPAGAGPGTTLQAQHNGMTLQVQVSQTAV